MEKNARPLNEQAVQLACWPTPMAGTPATENYNEAGNTDSSRRTVELCAWATPQAFDANACRKGTAAAFRDRNRRAMGGTGGPSKNLREQAELCRPAPSTASGGTLTGSSAGMGSGGQLNPHHSSWLMGYGILWEVCAPMRSKGQKRP
jgi:hypothetical protein